MHHHRWRLIGQVRTATARHPGGVVGGVAAEPMANTSPPGPQISTASPSPNVPATDRTPAGSNDTPRSLSAFRAPSSTVRRPAVSTAKPIHSLRAERRRSCGRTVVPTPAAPATASTSPSGLRDPAMTARTPENDAMRAARSLDTIPPLPWADPAPPAIASNSDFRGRLEVGETPVVPVRRDLPGGGLSAAG